MTLTSLKLPQRPAFARSTQSNIIVSTYQLEQDDSRIGSIYVLSHSLDIVKRVVAPAGVFRFELIDQYTIISAVTDGSLFIVSLSDPYTSKSLRIAEDLLLDVSLPSSNTVVCTDNIGFAHLVDLSTGSQVAKWKAHSLPYSNIGCEVWTCALHCTLVCTGGDDASVKIWDIRNHSAVQQQSGFNAGVTFVDWKDDNTIVTGSYDQKIRVFDVRFLQKPFKVLETLGGVWHVEDCERYHTRTKFYLAACMYGGWSLFDHNFEHIMTDHVSGDQLLYGVTIINGAVVYTTFNDFMVSVATL